MLFLAKLDIPRPTDWAVCREAAASLRPRAPCSCIRFQDLVLAVQFSDLVVADQFTDLVVAALPSPSHLHVNDCAASGIIRDN